MAVGVSRPEAAPSTERPKQNGSDSSTIPEEPSFRRVKRAQWGRRVLLGLLAAILIAGLIGLLGIRTRTAEATSNGYDLQVHFASIGRPGVEVPLDIQVQKDGGFSGPIKLAVPSSYLASMDAQSPQPEPSSTTSDGDLVVMQFDPPQGDTFGVSWSAQVDSSGNPGRREATIAVIGDDGNPAVGVSIRTWVLP
jgi:hypothetical protein